MATIVPISTLPNGVVSTIAALRAINVSTISDGATVSVLGSGSSNDGFQNTFYFSGASTLTDNGANVISTPSTGAWIGTNLATLVVSPLQTAAYSGVNENLVLISGGASLTTYTLPPSYVMFGQTVTIKSLGTGQIKIQATGGDQIFPTSASNAVATITFQSSGAAYNLLATKGIYYQQ